MRKKIDFSWEADEERLRRWVKVSPQRKLEWLNEMHNLIRLAWTKKQKEFFWKSRKENSFQ